MPPLCGGGIAMPSAIRRLMQPHAAPHAVATAPALRRPHQHCLHCTALHGQEIPAAAPGCSGPVPRGIRAIPHRILTGGQGDRAGTGAGMRNLRVSPVANKPQIWNPAT
jgi:hypothetical protein